VLHAVRLAWAHFLARFGSGCRSFRCHGKVERWYNPTLTAALCALTLYDQKASGSRHFSMLLLHSCCVSGCRWKEIICCCRGSAGIRGRTRREQRILAAPTTGGSFTAICLKCALARHHCLLLTVRVFFFERLVCRLNGVNLTTAFRSATALLRPRVIPLESTLGPVSTWPSYPQTDDILRRHHDYMVTPG
jgi:hypothetical protein